MWSLNFLFFWGVSHKTRLKQESGLFSTLSLLIDKSFSFFLDTNPVTCKWSNLCHRYNAGHRTHGFLPEVAQKAAQTHCATQGCKSPNSITGLFLLHLVIHEDVHFFGSHAAPSLTWRSMACYINYLCTLPNTSKRTRRVLTKYNGFTFTFCYCHLIFKRTNFLGFPKIGDLYAAIKTVQSRV